MDFKKQLSKVVRALGYEVSVARVGRGRSRRTDRLSLHDTATGKYYLPTDARGDVIAKAIKADQIFDAAIFDVAREHILPGTIALDVGANFGQMSVLMSKLVGAGGIVYAFDADDFVFRILEKNASANAKNIRPVFGAVHDKAGETLYFPVQDFERFGTYGSYGIDYVHGCGRPVPTVVIDDLDLPLPVSFMKVDIQGGDLHAMKGAARTMAKHRMPIIFEYEYLFEDELKLSFQEYVAFVLDAGYYFAKVINGQNYLVLPRP
jgi:FkbM family methyltransferase